MVREITLKRQIDRFKEDGTLQQPLIAAADAVFQNSLKARLSQEEGTQQIELNIALRVMRDFRYLNEALEQLRDIIIPREFKTAEETLDFIGRRLEGLNNPTISVWSGGGIIMMAFEHRRPIRHLVVHWDISQNPAELRILKIETSAGRAVSWIDKTIRMLEEGYDFVPDPTLDEPRA